MSPKCSKIINKSLPQADRSSVVIVIVVVVVSNAVAGHSVGIIDVSITEVEISAVVVS